ncbi:MAG TPA: hypothetical protein VD790_12660 [Thermoleophilaceae bacterium]|nr:hypothetical protein [Thermoleophilaceae bacterium]
MRSLQKNRIAYTLALAAMALVIGCGGDDDSDSNNADRYEGTEAEVAAVVDDFVQAGRDGDIAKICEEIFAEQLKSNIERASQQSCQSEVEGNIPEDDFELEINSLQLDGENAATVNVTDHEDVDSTLHIERVEGTWRIAAVTDG